MSVPKSIYMLKISPPIAPSCWCPASVYGSSSLGGCSKPVCRKSMNNESGEPSLGILPFLMLDNWASQVELVVKNPPANAGDIRDTSSIPGLGRFPWRRAQQPTPVLLPGDSHRQRSLAAYSP